MTLGPACVPAMLVFGAAGFAIGYVRGRLDEAKRRSDDGGGA